MDLEDSDSNLTVITGTTHNSDYLPVSPAFEAIKLDFQSNAVPEQSMETSQDDVPGSPVISMQHVSGANISFPQNLKVMEVDETESDSSCSIPLIPLVTTRPLTLTERQMAFDTEENTAPDDELDEIASQSLLPQIAPATLELYNFSPVKLLGTQNTFNNTSQLQFSSLKLNNPGNTINLSPFEVPVSHNRDQSLKVNVSKVHQSSCWEGEMTDPAQLGASQRTSTTASLIQNSYAIGVGLGSQVTVKTNSLSQASCAEELVEMDKKSSVQIDGSQSTIRSTPLSSDTRIVTQAQIEDSQLKINTTAMSKFVTDSQFSTQRFSSPVHTICSNDNVPFSQNSANAISNLAKTMEKSPHNYVEREALILTRISSMQDGFEVCLKEIPRTGSSMPELNKLKKKLQTLQPVLNQLIKRHQVERETLKQEVTGPGKAKKVRLDPKQMRVEIQELGRRQKQVLGLLQRHRELCVRVKEHISACELEPACRKLEFSSEKDDAVLQGKVGKAVDTESADKSSSTSSMKTKSNIDASCAVSHTKIPDQMTHNYQGEKTLQTSGKDEVLSSMNGQKTTTTGCSPETVSGKHAIDLKTKTKSNTKDIAEKPKEKQSSDFQFMSPKLPLLGHQAAPTLSVSPTGTSMSSDVFLVKAKELQKRMKKRAILAARGQSQSYSQNSQQAPNLNIYRGSVNQNQSSKTNVVKLNKGRGKAMPQNAESGMTSREIIGVMKIPDEKEDSGSKVIKDPSIQDAKFHQMTFKDTSDTIAISQIPEPWLSKSAGFLSQQASSAEVNLKQLLPLKSMIDNGLIQPGTNVLSFQTMEKIQEASLLHTGLIRSSVGRMYKTPMQWASAISGGPVVKKSMAYKQVLYKGRPLSTICREYAVNTAKTEQALKSMKKQNTSGTNTISISQRDINPKTEQKDFKEGSLKTDAEIDQPTFRGGIPVAGLTAINQTSYLTNGNRLPTYTSQVKMKSSSKPIAVTAASDSAKYMNKQLIGTQTTHCQPVFNQNKSRTTVDTKYGSSTGKHLYPDSLGTAPKTKMVTTDQTGSAVMLVNTNNTDQAIGGAKSYTMMSLNTGISTDAKPVDSNPSQIKIRSQTMASKDGKKPFNSGSQLPLGIVDTKLNLKETPQKFTWNPYGAKMEVQKTDAGTLMPCTKLGDTHSLQSVPQSEQTQGATVEGRHKDDISESKDEESQYLSELLYKCKVLLVSDKEMIPCDDLPDNFWETDFSKISLDREFWDCLDVW